MVPTVAHSTSFLQDGDRSAMEGMLRDLGEDDEQRTSQANLNRTFQAGTQPMGMPARLDHPGLQQFPTGDERYDRNTEITREINEEDQVQRPILQEIA